MMASEMPRLLAMTSMNARAAKRDLETGEGLADLMAFAFWDGVLRMSQVALDVGTGSATSDASLAYLVAYAAGLRETVRGEGDSDGGAE